MISALNEDGQPVDGFFCYKLPKLNGAESYSGYEYCFASSENDWKPSASDLRLDQGQGAIYETLAQLSNADYILYNDERPDGKPDNGELGHTKGVLAWDTASETGFWLLHSWPLFPVLGAVNAPTPDYGQTFLCLSLTLSSLQEIASQMIGHQEPQVYASTVNTSGSGSTATVSVMTGPTAIDPLSILGSGHVSSKPAPSFDSLDLTTVGGMPFKVLAKNRQWNDDFWNDGVGPALDCTLEVETWIRGAIAPVADAGGVYRCIDVKFVNLGSLGMTVAFPETSDHAKHAISNDPNNPYVCVGDINRMVSQRKRGGGCIAFQNLNLWSALSKADLIVPAPGQTREQAHAHIKATHVKASL